MNDLLASLVKDCSHYTAQGHVATYIPQLANVDPNLLGGYVSLEDGRTYSAGNGVGGGIMGVIPKRMGIGVYAPALDKRGNSVAGVKLLAKLSQILDLSIY